MKLRRPITSPVRSLPRTSTRSGYAWLMWLTGAPAFPICMSLADAAQACRKARRSALIVSACVVGMPCGNPSYVFSVPFCTSFADSGPESA